jgi:hypothetical protein
MDVGEETNDVLGNGMVYSPTSFPLCDTVAVVLCWLINRPATTSNSLFRSGGPLKKVYVTV